MIIKSLAVFVVVSVLYLWAAPKFPSPQVGLQGGSQWDKNRMNAEAILYGVERYDVVVVGSSIAARLVDLPSNWFNLAMPGESSIAGVELLVRSNLPPCTVALETNTMRLESDEEFYDGFVSSKLKKRFPALRSQNMPSHVGLRIVAKTLGFRPGDARRTKNEFDDQPDRRTVSDELFGQMLRRRLEVCREIVDPTEIAVRLDRLKLAVEKLEARGFDFVLIEFPECNETYDTLLRIQIRNAMKRTFPVSEYRWFDDQENHHLYTTNDAIHLIPESGARFASKVVDIVETRYVGIETPSRFEFLGR